MHSNNYILMYITGMSLIVAVVLAFTYSGLAPIHKANEEIFKKRDILSAVKDQLDTDILNCSDEEVFEIFEKRINQEVIDANGEVIEGAVADDIDMKQEEKKPLEERQYPVYIFQGDNNSKYYLVAVRGNGLWDKIWATVAIAEDFNTIAGISFDHVTETAGLGAEIKDSEAFKRAFHNKKLYNETGEFTSVSVVKGGVKIPNHQVDAIAGATITSNGVTEMMDRGLAIYLPYFDSLKK